ncbi:holo-ACP synthase [Luteococcus sp. H138]|uniref:holo-ACP synthase n=1 Tax=unclassified Luteococcus TaxID=2639923 RepID=UPI00313C8503
MTVAEVADSLDRFGDRYLRRVYRPAEHSGNPAELAGRFAAKEAVFKALRADPRLPIPWTEIEITTTGSRPGVVLHGRARSWAVGQGISRIELSICHDHQRAMAFAVAL